MNSERWRQIEQLYHSALKQEPALRSGFLTEACQDDSDLRREVETLLARGDLTGNRVDPTSSSPAGGSTGQRTGLTPGVKLGPYEILGLLGTGGMGEVYRAVDTRLDRQVAIKTSQEQFSSRFEREGRAISALNHPHICTLYDVGEVPSGGGYLVTELVEGETLGDWLKRAPAVERKLQIARQVLEALRAAHRAGIIHRDLKPQNIMVRFDGYVKVLDFGLAKQIPASGVLQGETTAMTDLSLPGQILGTVAYMSPEQILGQEIDERSDLFAFGSILFEMLTGQRPWHGTSTVDTLHAILHDYPPPIDETSPVGSELAGVVQKLLQKSPAERYATAEAVLEALPDRASSQSSSATTGTTQKPLTSIAVLPFVFLTEIQEQKAFSLGFADALITLLGSLEDVAVAPTSAILNYPPGAEPARVCRDLRVRHTLQGNVQKLGAQWLVSIQLFDGATQKIAFAEKYDFVLENVFDVQDEIGRRVVESLQSRFPLVAPKSRDRYSSDPEAYDEFMSGLRESYSGQPEVLQSASDHLSRAIDRDPDFALAHAWLSYVSTNMNFHFDSQPVWMDKAEHHCGRALTLDPALPEGHLARSWILWSPAKNFQHAEAIAELEQVLAMRPNFEQAHNRMCAICLHIGRFPEGRIAHEQAQRSNPKTRSINLEDFYLWSGDFARAEEAGQAYPRDRPGTALALHFAPQPALLSGDLDLADQRLAAALNQLPGEPLIVSLQGMLHARRNQPELALECVRRALESPRSFGHTHHTYYQIASVYAVLGDRLKAMAWLERGVDTGFACWPFFKIDPHLENLRGEPEFERLVTNLERKYTALKIQRL